MGFEEFKVIPLVNPSKRMSAHARVRDVRDNPHKIIGTLQEADWIAGYLDKVTGYLHAKEDNASGGNSPEMAR